MKKAQIIIEYAILSAVAIIIVAITVIAFNVANLTFGSTFGFKSEGSTITVPPMTP